MIRKTVFLLLILTGIVPIACCPEAPKGPYRVELHEVYPLKSNFMRPVTTQGESYLLRSDELYQGDTLLLNLNFYSLLAHHQPTASLHASALAFSCDNYTIYTHLQDKVTSVALFSDQPFQGIPAGEPLTELVSVYYSTSRDIVSLAQAITNINTLSSEDGRESWLGTLVLPGKPAESASRTFTVHIAYESGLEQTATSIPVLW